MIISGKIGRRSGAVLPDNSVSDGAFTCSCVLNRDKSGFGAAAVLPAIMPFRSDASLGGVNVILPGDRVHHHSRRPAP